MKLLASAGSLGVSGCIHEEPDVDVDSRFSGEDCPRLRDVDAGRCYHEVGESLDLYVVPETEHFDPKETEAELRINNDRDVAATLQDGLYKQVEGGWVSVPILRLRGSGDAIEVGPGETEEFSFEFAEGTDVSLRDRTMVRDLSNLRFTGAGTYAFSFSLSPDESLELTASAEFEGPELQLEPLEVEEGSVEDDVVDVELTGSGSGSVEVMGQELDSFDEGELDPLYLEHVVQMAPVNNLLYYMEDDVEGVRFHGDLQLLAQMEQLWELSGVVEMNVGDDSEELPSSYSRQILATRGDEGVEELPETIYFRYEGGYYGLTVTKVEGI